MHAADAEWHKQNVHSSHGNNLIQVQEIKPLRQYVQNMEPTNTQTSQQQVPSKW